MNLNKTLSYWFYEIKDYVYNAILKLRAFYLLKTRGDIHSLLKVPILKGYNLKFSDAFLNPKLNESKWSTVPYHGFRYHTGNILNNHTAPPTYAADDCVRISENYGLDLTVKKENVHIHHVDYDGKDYGEYIIPYKNGYVSTHKSLNVKYGYFEIASKISRVRSQFPAFWLASTESWPPEIDIYEIATRDSFEEFTTTIHWIDDNGKHKMKPMNHKVSDLTKGYNRFAVDWRENYIRFYFNDVLIRQITNPYILEKISNNMHVIINNSIDEKVIDKIQIPNDYIAHHYALYVKVYD